MAQPPLGTVTFLFTDVEGSTKLWQQHPDSMDAALKRHHAILNESIAAHSGYVFQIIGDAFCAAFSTANDGLDAALEAQRLLTAEKWGEIGSIRVRMALHTGRAELQLGEYTSGEYVSGLTLSRTARLLSAGHGGQILLSLATVELVRDHLPVETTLRDLGARRLKDLIRPEQIFQVVTPNLPCDFAPLKTLDVHPHNLPVQLTSFIGREKEMGEIKKLLAGTHLLTLTGIGGTGKTRLSLQVAADLIDEFPGGVWLVELAPLRDPALVDQTVASVLGVREQPDCSLSNLLVEYVRDRQLLLILDNCEHVVEACAQLANLLLRTTPELEILATSRVHLNLAGEMTYPVPPLALPEPGRAVTVHALAQYEAVRLFIERVIAVQPSFRVANENASAIAQICTHLDGIPLAIELAAARIRHLSPDQISSRLDDRFNLLTGGSRAALPRQQTLRAALDWSYDLLSMAERTLFNRLAVFGGSFSLEAAEAICTDENASKPDPSGISPPQVLDLLSALVDHSLVNVQEKNNENRYFLLETVRQYALEKLQVIRMLPAMQDRHLAYFCVLVQDGESRSWVGDPLYTSRFETEYDNIRSAMNYALTRNIESSIMMQKSLLMFFEFTSRYREPYDWAIRAVALTEGWPSSNIRAMALWLAGDRGINRHEFQKAQILLEDSLQMARQLDNRNQIKYSLRSLAWLFTYLENWEQVRNYAEQALLILQELDDKDSLQKVLEFLGLAMSHSGDNQAAHDYLVQSLKIARQENYPQGIVSALLTLAEIAHLHGNLTQAIELYTECGQVCKKIGDRWDDAITKYRLGQIAFQEGDASKARAFFTESLTLYSENDYEIGRNNYLFGMASVASLLNQHKNSVLLFGAFEAISEKHEIPPIMSEITRLIYDPIIASLRLRLGKTAFNRLWAEGRQLTLEQALELAQK